MAWVRFKKWKVSVLSQAGIFKPGVLNIREKEKIRNVNRLGCRNSGKRGTNL